MCNTTTHRIDPDSADNYLDAQSRPVLVDTTVELVNGLIQVNITQTQAFPGGEAITQRFTLPCGVVDILVGQLAAVQGLAEAAYDRA